MKLVTKIMLAIIVVSGLIAALAATVQVTLAQGGPGDKITICHAAGLAGTTHFVTLELPPAAVFGPAGHFHENGTTQAGHEEDYMGACTTDTTGTTDTTPTTGTTTTTPTTTGDERGVATAGAICIASENRYRVFGEIDGVVATVSPQFIAGDRNGPTLVNVTVGSDSQIILVNTAGTCISTTTTTGPPDSPPGTTTSTTPTPPATTTSETVTTPPTTTSGVLPATTTTETTPEAPVETTPTETTRTPAITPKPPVVKPKPKVPAAGIPVPPQGCPEGSLPYQGKCYPAKFGGPVLPGQQG